MEKGSKTAKEVFDNYIDYLAVGIESIINIFDPERILIAGGISQQKRYTAKST